MSETVNLKIPFIQAAQNQKEVTANAAIEALDNSANAAVAVAMADANITLTDAQALRAGLVTLTGSNTAVRKVTLPSKARRLAIQNSTGGALDITVGYATGATVTVGNGAIVLLQGNGTNCYGVGGAAALGDLADVVGPFLNGDLLQFDGAAWRPLGTGILSRVMLPFKGALVRRASTLSITTTPTAVPFTDATYDTNGFWSGGLPTRLTVPAGVTKVRLWARLRWTGGSANHGARIYKNGAAFVGQGDFKAASGYTDADYSFGSAVVAATAGDYFELQPYASVTRTGGANEVQFAIEVVETADAANPTLLALTDTPASYTGAAGKLLRVNGGATAVEFGLRHNMAASLDPGPGDDSGVGYSVGSIWFNGARDTLWLCQDASGGAASWQPYLSRRALHGGYGNDPDQVMATGPLNATSGVGVTVVDRLYLRPFRWFGGRSIDRLFARVTTAGTASNIKFGLWGHDYGTGRPTGLPLGANNASLSTTTVGIKSAAIPAVDPAPGILWVASIHEGTTTPGMQAAPAGHFDVWEFVPIPGGDFSLLMGAANQGTYGLVCSDVTFAADITAIDLTSATFARSSGNASIHPHVMIGF